MSFYYEFFQKTEGSVRVSMDAHSLNAPVLTGLNLPWAALLAKAGKLTAPADSLLSQHIPGLDFYYLASGKIIVMHADPEGRERTMFRLGPGCLFNEASAAAGFDAPNSPFYCEQDCVYYRFPHTLLHSADFIREHPELVSNLLKGLGVKVLIHHTSLSNFTGLPAIARLSRFLVGMCRKHGCLSFDPAMTQEDMAALLGMNRATMVRALHVLKEKGAVSRLTKHLLEIKDLTILQKLSEN